MKRVFLVVVCLAIAAAPAYGANLLDRAWPAGAFAPVGDIGTGIGVVFTPDLSVEGNCRFYEALGFACFESADWLDVLARLHAHNTAHPGRRIRTLILETHGTNGHGLKLQAGKKPEDDRSYIAVGALQELVEPVGVRSIVISACNSGRLLRPTIYRRLERNPGDKLFLPATRGIIDATAAFDPEKSAITVITPARSHIETTLVGSMRELSPPARSALEKIAAERGIALPERFAISEMMIRMLLRDPALELRTGAHDDELSAEQSTPAKSEELFRAFVDHLGKRSELKIEH
jgi:hypothetical protein